MPDDDRVFHVPFLRSGELPAPPILRLLEKQFQRFTVGLHPIAKGRLKP